MANLEKTPVQATQTGIPATYHDEQDGTYSLAIAARMRIWDGADWVRWDGAVTGGGGAGGSVTQGTSPWVVSAASLPLPTGASKDSTLTDGTQRVGGTVAVSGTFWQSTQPVSIASMPTTAVTGPLTDTQLRASAVPVSLASAPTTAVTQSTSPWVTNDPGLPDTLGQKAMSGSTGVTIASDQTSFPVAATLSAETTKVIGTVNQGTSPWVVSGGANVFHVDDNSSSLTVDAPVATPVFTRLSDGSAALIGQKAMTASLPVVLASDQASVPVAATLTAETTKVIGTVNQGTSPWVTSRNWTLATGTDSVTVGNATMPTTPVTGTFWQSTQPVSNAGTFAVQTSTEVATAVHATGTLPSVVKVTGGYDGGFVRALKSDVTGALFLASQQGTQDDLLLELKKHTVALSLLLSQFTGESDIEWMVN